jgi:hypothetical protein
MRAPRFPLHLHVRYRCVDTGRWHLGVTENISHSGALVRVEDPLQVDTPVEVRLVLAPETAGESAQVACRGRVVRTVPPDDTELRPGFAVSIETYDFLPGVGESSSEMRV